MVHDVHIIWSNGFFFLIFYVLMAWWCAFVYDTCNVNIFNKEHMKSLKFDYFEHGVQDVNIFWQWQSLLLPFNLGLPG